MYKNIIYKRIHTEGICSRSGIRWWLYFWWKTHCTIRVEKTHLQQLPSVNTELSLNCSSTMFINLLRCRQFHCFPGVLVNQAQTCRNPHTIETTGSQCQFPNEQSQSSLHGFYISLMLGFECHTVSVVWISHPSTAPITKGHWHSST